MQHQGKRGVAKGSVNLRWKEDDEWGNTAHKVSIVVRYVSCWAAQLVQPAYSDPRNGVQTLANG